MRIRRSITAAAVSALALAGGSAPARAEKAGVVHMTITIGCYGCGVYGPTGNSVAFSCYGVCDVGGPCTGTCHYTGTGTVSIPTDVNCNGFGSLLGSLGTPYGTVGLGISWIPGAMLGSVDNAALNGTWAATSPMGLVCGGAVEVTFVGTVAGF